MTVAARRWNWTDVTRRQVIWRSGQWLADCLTEVPNHTSSLITAQAMRDNSFTPWDQSGVRCGYHFLQFASHPFKVQWLLYVPPGLTFSKSTFCPHSVFVYFVWISEQTAIISLYNINWLVFITETVCVYCAVRAELLSIIQVSFCRQGLVLSFPLALIFVVDLLFASCKSYTLKRIRK